MKKGQKRKQVLESPPQRKRSKQQEILDADSAIQDYDKKIETLIDLFSRDKEEEDITRNYLNAKSYQKLQNKMKFELSDFKNFSFSLGNNDEFGDFAKGDQVKQIENVSRSSYGKLKAKVIWKERPDGTLPKSKEYFTHEIAKYAPQKLIKFYKSKLIVQRAEI